MFSTFGKHGTYIKHLPHIYVGVCVLSIDLNFKGYSQQVSQQRTSVQAKKHASEKSTLALKPRADVTRSISLSVAPQKVLMLYKNFLKKMSRNNYHETDLTAYVLEHKKYEHPTANKPQSKRYSQHENSQPHNRELYLDRSNINIEMEFEINLDPYHFLDLKQATCKMLLRERG